MYRRRMGDGYPYLQYENQYNHPYMFGTDAWVQPQASVPASAKKRLLELMHAYPGLVGPLRIPPFPTGPALHPLPGSQHTNVNVDIHLGDEKIASAVGRTYKEATEAACRAAIFVCQERIKTALVEGRNRSGLDPYRPFRPPWTTAEHAAAAACSAAESAQMLAPQTPEMAAAVDTLRKASMGVLAASGNPYGRAQGELMKKKEEQEKHDAADAVQMAVQQNHAERLAELAEAANLPAEAPPAHDPGDEDSQEDEDPVPAANSANVAVTPHPRTLLQELVHANPAFGELQYDQLSDSGLDQPGRYLVGVTLGGELIATARARNKKEACTAAAAQALIICQQRLAGMSDAV